MAKLIPAKNTSIARQDRLKEFLVQTELLETTLEIGSATTRLLVNRAILENTVWKTIG